MNDRTFSDSVQYQAVLANLEKNNGQLRCASCGKALVLKSECHFDHIVAYAKGGKSTFENCQILCVDCNLAKSDKEFNDFLLEEKAKRFMTGESIEDAVLYDTQNESFDSKRMTKEQFDEIVAAFISRTGGIRKVDFTRDKNGLPSITYVTKYYGTISNLKLAFGLDIGIRWDRENIWNALVEYSKINPTFKQKDLNKENKLPSLPCILSYYPEYKNFSEIKKALGLDLNYELWTKERVLEAGKEYLKSHDKITQKDLGRENRLPTTTVIYNFFGNMQNFQEAIGSEVSKRQKFVTKEEIIEVTKEFMNDNGSTFESRVEFFDKFPFSQSVVVGRFGSFESFANCVKININKTKKAKFTKQEVDNSILAYLKSGNQIPTSAKQLVGLGLPSNSTILRFYENWKEPFVIFSKILDFTG